AIHEDGADVDAFGDGDGELSGAGGVALGHVEALRYVLGKFFGELAGSGAGGKGVIVVEDDFEAVLLGLFEGEIVEAEVLGAEEGNRGLGAGAESTGFDEEAAVIEVGELPDAGDDVLVGEAVEREGPHGVTAVGGGRVLEDGRVGLGEDGGGEDDG